jgi:hypothetical protein
LTSSSSRRICSACSAWARTCSDVAPLGGAIVTWTIFSEPALMNAVGSWLMRAAEAKEEHARARNGPIFVQRLLRTHRIAGS